MGKQVWLITGAGRGMAAVERFGRIDVLVNDAASFYAGYFEALTPAQIDRQLATSLLGPMHVTRAVLPVMRQQRSGHIITISSSAGIAAGFDFRTALLTGEARASADHDRSPATTPAPPHRRCGCHCERRAEDSRAEGQIDANRDLSTSLAFD